MLGQTRQSRLSGWLEDTVVPGCNNMLDFWIFILLHFVITLEAPLDVEQAAACGSPGEEDGPPRTGNSIDYQGRLMLWGI